MPTPRTPTFNSLAVLTAVLALAAPAFAARAPEPEALLDIVLAPPQIPYKGRVLVTQWYGKQTRAEEMHVYVLPPDKIRREFLAPDGAVTRVSISDGDVESVHLLRAGKTVRGNAVRSDEKVLPPELERRTLLSNYDLFSSTGENAAGRSTWRLTLKPRVEGKPWQALWVDQDTKVILRSKRYLPRRAFGSQAQFLSFEPRKDQDAALFEVDEATGAIEARGLTPQFLSREDLNRETGDAAAFPERIPGGFVFESADVFPVGRSKVRHARYTDGLTVVSIFQTDRPVKLPKGGVIPTGSIDLPGPLRASPAGKLIEWSRGPRHYTLMGDVSRELVSQIIKGLR